MNREGDRQSVAELIERREAIQSWLDRLEAQQGTASGKILDRVRADYEGRLRETLEALANHRGAVQEELREAEERLASAEKARAEAGDGLEEGHLRHRIGELDDTEWDARRVRLEDAAERSQRAELQAAADVSHLRELLEQLAERRPVELQTIPEPEDVTLEAGPESLPGADEFLADIDRALAQEGGEEDDSSPDAGAGRKPGLKCPDCGYTNDISAWFCGVCGADIG